MPLDCTVDASGCIVCPAIPHVAAVPPHLDSIANSGWNAGAYSAEMLFDWNVHTVFQVPAGIVGVVCGFRYDHDDPTTPSRIPYAFYLTQVAGIDFYSILEYGVEKRGAATRDSGYSFEIRRQGTKIQYLVNDGMTTTMVYQSTAPSAGGLLVVGCLFNSGDSIL